MSSKSVQPETRLVKAKDPRDGKVKYSVEFTLPKPMEGQAFIIFPEMQNPVLISSEDVQPVKEEEYSIALKEEPFLAEFYRKVTVAGRYVQVLVGSIKYAPPIFKTEYAVPSKCTVKSQEAYEAIRKTLVNKGLGLTTPFTLSVYKKVSDEETVGELGNDHLFVVSVTKDSYITMAEKTDPMRDASDTLEKLQAEIRQLKARIAELEKEKEPKEKKSVLYPFE